MRERATRRAPPRQHSKPCDITASKWPRADTQWRTTDWHQSEKGPPGWGYIRSSESFEATESCKVSKEQEGEARKQRWGVGGGRNHESVAYGFGRSRSYIHIFSSRNKATLAFCESYWYKGRFPPAQGHKQTLLNVIYHVYHGPCVTVSCGKGLPHCNMTLLPDHMQWLDLFFWRSRDLKSRKPKSWPDKGVCNQIHRWENYKAERPLKGNWSSGFQTAPFKKKISFNFFLLKLGICQGNSIHKRDKRRAVLVKQVGGLGWLSYLPLVSEEKHQSVIWNHDLGASLVV